MNDDEERLAMSAWRGAPPVPERSIMIERVLVESSRHAIARRRAELDAHYHGVEIDDED